MIKTIKSAKKYPQIAFIIDKQEIITGKTAIRVSLIETNEKNPLKAVWI